MMLLSFITVIGYQGLMFSAKQWQYGHDKMLFQYDYHQAVSWIREKVGSSEKVSDPASTNYAYLFNGQKRSVEFVTRYNRTRQGGLYVNKVEYNEEDGNINVIYYLYHPDINIDAASQLQWVSLLSSVKSVEFSYYGRKKGAAARWYGEWFELNSLPQLLKLDITNDDGEHYRATIHLVTANNV